MQIICREKWLICDEDPGDGVLLVRYKAHKEFGRDVEEGMEAVMQAITHPKERRYKLPKHFNPKKIIGVQYIPHPTQTNGEGK